MVKVLEYHGIAKYSPTNVSAETSPLIFILCAVTVPSLSTTKKLFGSLKLEAVIVEPDILPDILADEEYSLPSWPTWNAEAPPVEAPAQNAHSPVDEHKPTLVPFNVVSFIVNPPIAPCLAVIVPVNEPEVAVIFPVIVALLAYK